MEQELIEDIEGLASQYLDNRTDLVQVRTKLEQVQEEQGRAEEEMKATMDQLEMESRRNREEWVSREGEAFIGESYLYDNCQYYSFL